MVDTRFLIIGGSTLLGRRFKTRLTELGHDVTSCHSLYGNTGGYFDFIVQCSLNLGITGNEKYPADLMDNALHDVEELISGTPPNSKCLYLASSCCYPPRDEAVGEELFGLGPLESISSYYATAKIAAVKLLQAHVKQYKRKFICAVPTNTFGPEDDVGQNNHVVAGIMSKIHEAKINDKNEVVLYGNGTPVRELMYADDVVDACLHLLFNYDSPEVINVASGDAVTIRCLAQMIAEVVGYEGKITWDTTKPNGAPYKALKYDKLKSLGWHNQITELREALGRTYAWFKETTR